MLIDSERLKQAILTFMPERSEVLLIVDNQPDAVVRCKDCKHYRINTVYPCTNMIMTYCAKTGIAKSKSDDWFCADGVAKDINVLSKEDGDGDG